MVWWFNGVICTNPDWTWWFQWFFGTPVVCIFNLDFSTGFTQILQVKRVTSGWATTSRPPCWRSRRVGRSRDGTGHGSDLVFFFFCVGCSNMEDQWYGFVQIFVWCLGVQIWNMDDKWYGIFGITRITYDICMDFSRICWLRRFGTFWTECISSETRAWHAPGSRDAPGWWWFVPGRCRRERNIAGPRGCYNVDSDLSAVKHGKTPGKTMAKPWQNHVKPVLDDVGASTAPCPVPLFFSSWGLPSPAGQGLNFRPGSFDGAVSISAIQWLCNVEAQLQGVPMAGRAQVCSSARVCGWSDVWLWFYNSKFMKQNKSWLKLPLLGYRHLQHNPHHSRGHLQGLRGPHKIGLSENRAPKSGDLSSC